MSPKSDRPESLSGRRDMPSADMMQMIDEVHVPKDDEPEEVRVLGGRKVIKEDMFGNKYLDYP